MTDPNDADTASPLRPNSGRAGLAALFSARRFALMMVVLIIASYPQIILGARSFILRDYGLFGYPVAYYHRLAFWRGEIPLWNPYSSCGVPFLAQWNTLTLYPLSLIYLLFPLPWSLSLYCLAHLFLAGLGMYLLARRWSGNHFAAALAGVGYAFNGLALNSLAWPNNIAAIAWAPWVILSVEKAWRKGGKYTAIAAIVGALQMLTGAPEMIVCTWIIAGLIFALQLWGTRPRIRVCLRMVAVIGLVTALAAAQLLPFLELLASSNRDVQFGANSWSMPAWGWANLISPLFRCYESPSGVFFQSAQFWTSSYYLGLGILILAVSGIPTRSTYSFPLAVAALFGLVMALGPHGWLYPTLLRYFPALGFMRFPIKFVILPMYAFPLLAALGAREGIARLAEPGGRIPRRYFVAVAILGGAALFLPLVSYLHPFMSERPVKVLWSSLSRIGLVLLLLTGLIASQRARLPLRRNGFALLAVLCIWLDGFTHAPNQNPTVPSSAFQPGLVTAQLLSPFPAFGESRAMMSRETHEKFYTVMLPQLEKDYLIRRVGLFGNCNLLDSIPTIAGFYSLYVREQRDVWNHVFFSATNDFPEAVVDFLGVSQLTSRKELLEWETRTNWQPLVTIGRKPLFVKDGDTLDRLLGPDFDPHKVVIVSQQYADIVPVAAPARARVVSGEYHAEKISLDVEADAPGVVTLAQSYYHPWRARIDGKPTTLFPVNHAFQGLVSPAGKHHIDLVYVDDAFRGGMLVSFAGLIVCSWMLWRFGRRQSDRLQ